MPSILTLSGSPIRDSSTDLLLNRIAEGIESGSAEPTTNEYVRLNHYQFLPCQACGRSPEPDFCIFHDEIYPLYDLLISVDIVLFGSPVYFDSVSAQAKAFIDRCNCLRPPDFEGISGHHFKRIIMKKRLGGIVLVGGERGEFEGARKVIAGFFKWVEIENCGNILYEHKIMKEIGPVRKDPSKMDEAFQLGLKIASRLPEFPG